ncbi:MAG: FMN-binding protein [Pseudomonadota bacterium]
MRVQALGAGLCLAFAQALTLAVWSAVCSIAWADVYQTPEDFVRQAQADPASAQSLWLTGEIKQRIRAILGRDYPSLRLKYWRNGGQGANPSIGQATSQTIWVLEDIGKDEYITLGFVVQDGKIASSRVLIFRESRGWEIKFPSFAQQFVGAGLTDKLQLDRPLDGITGATLSVNAYERMARLALVLDQAAHEQDK